MADTIMEIRALWCSNLTHTVNHEAGRQYKIPQLVWWVQITSWGIKNSCINTCLCVAKNRNIRTINNPYTEYYLKYGFLFIWFIPETKIHFIYILLDIKNLYIQVVYHNMKHLCFGTAWTELVHPLGAAQKLFWSVHQMVRHRPAYSVSIFMWNHSNSLYDSV